MVTSFARSMPFSPGKLGMCHGSLLVDGFTGHDGSRLGALFTQNPGQAARIDIGDGDTSVAPR